MSIYAEQAAIRNPRIFEISGSAIMFFSSRRFPRDSWKKKPSAIPPIMAAREKTCLISPDLSPVAKQIRIMHRSKISKRFKSVYRYGFAGYLTKNFI